MAKSANSEAIRLAQASDWKGLQRLIERSPAVAKERGDHDMLPIHWACTVRRVPLSLVARLLQAHPDGVRAKNAGDLLPLHIAIRARAHASCLRKLVRAYPDSVNERTPDGVSALELAEQVGLDAEGLKVLYRVHERSSISQQQQHDERSSSERASSEFDPLKRFPSGQEEGEASGAGKPEENDEEQAAREWTANAPELFVGNTGMGGFLGADDDDEDGDGDEAKMMALEPEDSFSMLSEGSVSDEDGLDSPHDHLVSPSSTSTYSQGDGQTPGSSNSSPSTEIRSGFQHQHHALTRQQQARRHRTAAMLDQQPNSGLPSDHELHKMVSAMSASATMSNADEGTSSRSHGRHLSLPLMPSYENLRRDSSAHYYDEADEDDDDDNSSRDSGSPGGGPAGASGHARGRLFQSVQHPARSRHPTGPGGSQRGSPPVFRGSHRRASHGSHSRTGAHFESPPEWKHDDECSICRASFGMFKHRHHCRNCGKSICSQHSADKKLAMEAKGFTTPQRVCVTCYAMITHSRSLKQELDLEEAGREDSLLNPVAFQQQHYALTTGNNGTGGRASTAMRSFPPATAPGSTRSTIANDNSGLLAPEAPGSPPATSTAAAAANSRRSSSIAAGEATGGAGERATTSAHAAGAAGSASHVQSPPVHELRCLLASQQKQIEQLAQSNMQMQQQLLEQEELKAETMLLITQLMTRVSVLELHKDRSRGSSKRRSAGTGDSEDDEDGECPQDDALAFER
ncbi:hypothetical protein BBJ28_00006101 [Nothophytophthora sp. Chile5]|nr:hypothetical protein BBJ28_00006101 [Nothophytophthora sp. Chile5]